VGKLRRLTPRSRPAGFLRCPDPVLGSLLAALALLLPAPAARANGAFPGSLRVFAPAGQPEALLLATNFGLISTSNGGRRWDWICEHGDALFASLYELGSGPAPRLYAAGPIGLAVSEDGACSWTAPEQLQAATVTGIFADPGAAGTVWVAARTRDAGPGEGWALYLSTDGGASFGPPRYRVPLGATIDSLESARSQPQRLYLTVSHGGQPARVELVRSDDGGATFAAIDVSAATRGDQLRIAAVDPEDPARLYLRVLGFPDERLMISRDGGATLTDALVLARGRLSAFVRRADGSLVAGALSDTEGGSIHVSSDAGRSFQLRSTTIHPGALAERDGVLIASTDSLLDGFALARSVDAIGWEPIVRYQDVAGTRECSGGSRLAETCGATCIQQVVRGVFPPEACPGQAPRPVPVPDAGPIMLRSGGGGCACQLTASRNPTPGAPRWSPIGVVLPGLLFLTRMRKRPAPSSRPAA
jgi:photosystem II stability/assembly factor-like uncharacterized protein